MEVTSKTNSDTKPLFSIIMPCYNSEKYVDRAVQSCIKQTFNNWELIVINDGSTDNTLSIINNYISRDSRISVFSKENGGYVSAVNYGLDHVNGRYFMFLGSDDEICPSLFSDIFEQITDAESPDLIGFRTIISKGNEIKIEDKNSAFDVAAKEYGSDIKSFSAKYPKQSSIFFTRDTSKLYKTELLGSLRYFGKKGMDADGIFSMMFTHKASSFLCVPVFGYVWHLRPESLSGRKKDYPTQIDRIENWMKFGNELMKADPSIATPQEKYYLVNYSYSILESVYFTYRSNCLSDNIPEKAKDFLERIIAHWGIEKITKEIAFFLKHPLLWKICVIPKVFFDKLRKKLLK